MHVREVDGRSLRFGHRGWLWNNAYLLYDRETDSIWHHQTGWAMSGPLRGRSLRRFPTTQSTFAAWRAEHPRTLVLPKPAGDERPLDRDVYAGRNAGLVFGLGVDLPTGHRLYPLAALRAAGGSVCDESDGVPLVVALDDAARMAVAYDRRVGGDVLDLELAAAGADGPLLRERGGTRSWRLRSGRAASGADAPPLRALLASPWETSAWHLQHPRGSVWTPPAGDAAASPGGR